MKIEKKLVWRNQKCNECGKAIYKAGGNEQVHECGPEFLTGFKKWKLCTKCFNGVFSEKVKKDGR